MLIYDNGTTDHLWRRAGVRWVQSRDAYVESASFIVFVTDGSVMNLDGLAFGLHFWEGYLDSFAVHPWVGDEHVTTATVPHTVSPFTRVGPTGTEFQTFKVTFDLRGLPDPITLTAGLEYVMAPVALPAGPQLRLSMSEPPGGGDSLVDVRAIGRNDDTLLGPDLIDTLEPPRQFGASLTVNPVGDLNDDGWVDIFDVGIVSEHWTETGEPGIPGDANRDGTVSIFDVGIISENWMLNPGGSSVPEPSAIALAGTAIICVWMARQRR